MLVLLNSMSSQNGQKCNAKSAFKNLKSQYELKYFSQIYPHSFCRFRLVVCQLLIQLFFGGDKPHTQEHHYVSNFVAIKVL